MRRLIPLPAVVLLGACLASGGPRRAESPTAPPKNPATDPTAPPTAPPTAAEATMDDAWTTLCAQRADWLAALAATPAACVERQDTDHAVFHGCFDWHSSVHGHWAVLRAARALEAPTRAQPILDRLSPDGVAAEARLLAARPSFELPYGRAWFLLLAMEHAAAGAGDGLVAMADAQASALRRHYTLTPPTARSHEYRNASWALTQLHAWYRHRGDEAGAAWVVEVVGEHLSAVHAEVRPDRDLQDWPEFFSRWGNQALLLHRVLGPEALRAWLEPQGLDPAALQPVARPLNAHHLSMNYSRAWAFWSIFEATGDPAWRDAYARHVAAGWSLHAALADDYRAYGHWVPQFGIYALTAPDAAACP